VEKQELVFTQCGIPEGKISGWIKEEKKLHLFVDTVEENAEL
jgi:hypothetical protein